MNNCFFKIRNFSDNFPTQGQPVQNVILSLQLTLQKVAEYRLICSSNVLLSERKFTSRTAASSYYHILRRIVPHHHAHVAGNSKTGIMNRLGSESYALTGFG
jgi:hypothetical protein